MTVKILSQHVYGTSAFLRIEIRGHIAEMTVYWRETGESYSISIPQAPGAPTRQEVIDAYHKLF